MQSEMPVDSELVLSGEFTETVNSETNNPEGRTVIVDNNLPGKKSCPEGFRIMSAKDHPMDINEDGYVCIKTVPPRTKKFPPKK